MKKSMAGFHSPRIRESSIGITINRPTPMMILPVYNQYDDFQVFGFRLQDHESDLFAAMTPVSLLAPQPMAGDGQQQGDDA